MAHLDIKTTVATSTKPTQESLERVEKVSKDVVRPPRTAEEQIRQMAPSLSRQL
jgi:hypothetical protein